MKKLYHLLLLSFIILSACETQNQTVTSVPITPSPTATAIQILATPASAGDSIIWENLQVTMDELDITQEYRTEFGSTRTPPSGSKFLWVHIRLTNIGTTEIALPRLEHYSILYAATELKPTYGHRAGYTDYTSLDSMIFPDQQLDGWLRFDIPTAAELGELLFVFIPESAQIGTSYSSPNYPYAPDKPTYVWKLAL